MKPISRARATDPETSHRAAETQTVGRINKLVISIWRAVTKYPHQYQRWYINVVSDWIERNADRQDIYEFPPEGTPGTSCPSCHARLVDDGWYGTFATCFKTAEALGLIHVDEVAESLGEKPKLSDYTRNEVQTYSACPREEFDRIFAAEAARKESGMMVQPWPPNYQEEKQ